MSTGEMGINLQRAGVHWELICSGAAAKSTWRWCRISADGSREQRSLPYPDLGKAMSSALANGFRPTADYWVIKTKLSTTLFPPGDKPVLVIGERRDRPFPDGYAPPELRTE